MSKAYLELLRDKPEFAQNYYDRLELGYSATHNPGDGLLKDLIVEAVKEVLGSALGIDDILELKQLIDRNGVANSLGKGAFKLIWRFVKKKSPWLAAWDIITKTKDAYYKVRRTIDALEPLKNFNPHALEAIKKVINETGGGIA